MVKGSKGKANSSSAKKKGAADRQLSPEQLYEQAQFALQYDDFDAARTALKKAAQLAPSNMVILDALGALLAEIGPEKEALQVLMHCVQLSPDEGYEKYMYLGQLLDGVEAMDFTRKGVAVLQQHIQALQTAAPAGTSWPSCEEEQVEARCLGGALCGALCSLSEMILNQADDIAGVTAEVEGLLARASTADPSSPEPVQVLASMLYEQGRAEEALAALKRSMALWYTPTSQEEEEGEEDAMDEDSSSGDEEDSEDKDGPSYEFRIECAKLLLELEDTTTTAIDVLEGLIEENDSDPVTWHLLGLAYYSGHQYKEAAEIIDKGKALLAKLHAPKDDEIVSLFDELASAVSEAVSMEASQAKQVA